MKTFYRRLGLKIALALTPSFALFGADGDLGQDDVQALRDWINTKRQVTVREIGGNLSISGEVRAELQRASEVKNGVKQRGMGGATQVATNEYDIEVNLILDYRNDRTWAAIKIEFDNNAGLFTSTTNKIRIEKAYFGVRLFETDQQSVEVEVGRRSLSTMFDSKVEFSSLFDGVYFRYDTSFDRAGDVYAHIGAMLVDDRIDQYAYVAELGWLGIMNTGFYTKYSVMDWKTKDIASPGGLRFDYIVNQWIAGYKFIPQSLKKLVIAYTAFLWNPVAPRTSITNGRKVNLGGYAGFTIGELRKKGDWSFDANYQVVQAQVVPDFDAGGIGLGNASRTGLYTENINGTGKENTSATACGSNNFRGFMLTLDYLLTGNLNFQQQWLQSITLDKDIGPFRRFKQYEVEFIYGF